MRPAKVHSLQFPMSPTSSGIGVFLDSSLASPSSMLYEASQMQSDDAVLLHSAIDVSNESIKNYESILNITEDDDEDEDNAEVADGAMELASGAPPTFMTGDIPARACTTLLASHVPATPPMSAKPCCEFQLLVPPNSQSSDCSPTHQPAARAVFALDHYLSTNWVDTLCVPTVHDDNVTPTAQNDSLNMHRMLECDLLELLGCLAPPDATEMDRVWAWNRRVLNSQQKDDGHRPRKALLRERMRRVRRCLQERGLASRRTGLAFGGQVNLSPRMRSMDDRILQLYDLQDLQDVLHLEDELSKSIIGKTTTLPRAPMTIPFVVEQRGTNTSDGYDSDPEIVYQRRNSLSRCSPVLQARRSAIQKIAPSLSETDDGDSIGTLTDPTTLAHAAVDSWSTADSSQLVQTTLNYTWTVQWHRPLQAPLAVDAWLERGMLVQGNQVMLEPNIMWRDAVQTQLDRRVLNATTVQPYMLRLLTVQRITTPALWNRSLYPLVRTSCAFCLRTQDGSEFCFETATPLERDELVARWKLVVARFAMLAVLEDLDTIYEEYFCPSPTDGPPRMPTPCESDDDMLTGEASASSFYDDDEDELKLVTSSPVE